MSDRGRVVIVGAGGRMGKTLIRYLLQGSVPGLELAGAVDLWDCPDRDRDAGLASGVGEAGIVIGCDLARVVADADVLIDFSGSHGTAGNAPRYAEWGKPTVIGTTGIEEDGRVALQAAAARIPIVWAPNMSLGINLLLDLVRRTAETLRGRGYDIEIIERHHKHKKDAPSGTALALGRAAADGMRWSLEETAKHGREGLSKTDRPEAQIGFHAIRGGDFIGDHTVLFAADGECVELKHRATRRDTFALGALQAAKWVIGRPAGLYGMRDVLGLNG
ncbi:MAG: 4-hydroxy-tetrahydrodipicolinate reductase [Kiritimatiellia bacterium]|nr:4-hydroxy-tetrahydrodipicolinate reductase [Kiritimatiellia bacterium]